MIHIENLYLENLNSFSVEDHLKDTWCISSCVIDVLDVSALEFLGEVVIRNCVIHKLIIYSTWFAGGLSFVNNIVLSDIDYQMGGHNKEDLKFVGNLFKGYFSFFDCHFCGCVVVKDNIFFKNSDLLANEYKGFDNIFANGIVIENNVGRLDVLNLG